MKVRTLILGFFALLILAGCGNEVKQTEVSVMSFNIRHSTAEDGDNSWPYRKEATPAMLKALSPDLLGLQEAKIDQVQYIQENCPEYDHYGLGREDGVEDGEIMAVFYKKDKFNLLDRFTFWLSETPEVPSMGWDAACRRTATVCYLEDKETKQKFFYVNTHLDHVGREAQHKGLQLIVNRIKEINPEGYPLILGGDFNMRASNPAIIALDSLMLNTRTVAPKTDTLATFNAWRRPLENADLGSNLKRRPAQTLVIDYIFYSPMDSTFCQEFRTVTESYANVPFISDHYPIITYLKF